MDLERIKEIIKLAKDEGLEQISYEKGNEKISLKLGGVPPINYQPVATPVIVQQMREEEEHSSKKNSNSTLIDITSPFVGTFYRGPSPEAEFYVKIGDKVSVGMELCIVEAMKIMNAIESDVEGEIVEVCVENENYVEYGQVLFKIRPSK